MPVVVDANVLISILIAKGSKHKLFFSDKIIPITPEYVLFEMGKYWPEISSKTRLSERDLRSELFAVRLQIKTAALQEIKEFLKEAKDVSPDPDDAEYFALALKHGCPIWSHDRSLKKQNTVEVLDTKELLQKLGLLMPTKKP
ncbi:MAG: hypothetical protein JW724_07140 [Candidatus Altiarchaeota archaeon]|nr:hypothetical protein [Candidatus Altiarchaeota archaeon]